MLLGAALGALFGKSIEPIGEVGKVIIQLIKWLAAPLLFFAILDAFLRARINAMGGFWLVLISLINATLAMLIGFSISNTLRPGEHLAEYFHSTHSQVTTVFSGASTRIGFAKALTGSVLGLALLAVVLGLVFRKLRNKPIERGVDAGFRTTSRLLGWIIKLIPIAVFCVVAKTVGQYGLAPLRGLAIYLGVGLLGLALQVGVIYQSWIVFVVRMNLREFWRGVRDAVVYAMGASSSLATLPVTLRCMEQMKISTASARLSACVGTNLNNDGVLLYEALAVLFVAQVHGIELSFSQQLLAAGTCVLASFGVAGVPEAGLISLALVLNTVGLPLESLPLLLTVDWILGRARAMTNVTSDILGAKLLDHFAPPSNAYRR